MSDNGREGEEIPRSIGRRLPVVRKLTKIEGYDKHEEQRKGDEDIMRKVGEEEKKHVIMEGG